MVYIRRWLRRRQATFSLVVFFAVWYGIQLSVLHFVGDSTAEWLFYTELPPSVNPGLLFSPVSHDLDNPLHLLGNGALLLGVGGLAEPYIGRWKVAALVILGGYIGMAVTMLTAPLHHFWPLAGASTGILILWGYAGPRLSYESDFEFKIGVSAEGVEDIGVAVLLAGVPAILVYELLWNGNMSHITGVVIGVVFLLIETRF